MLSSVWDRVNNPHLCAGNGPQATTSDSQWRGQRGRGQDAMTLVVHYFGRLTHDRLADWQQTRTLSLFFPPPARGIMDHALGPPGADTHLPICICAPCTSAHLPICTSSQRRGSSPPPPPSLVDAVSR
jgi:hypothetical protein